MVDAWSKIESYFQDLLDREIQTIQELEKWMLDRSELEAVLEEEQAWRYIKMNIDTRDKDLSESFFLGEGNFSKCCSLHSHQLNLKLVENPFYKELDQEKYCIYLRGLDKAIEIYREENIPLFTKWKPSNRSMALSRLKCR